MGADQPRSRSRERTILFVVGGNAAVAKKSGVTVVNISPYVAKITYSRESERALKKCKKKDLVLFRRIQNAIERIAREPLIGKPLRHALKNRRRIHIGSFVLVYELYQDELRFVSFDHHDTVYKKYR